MNQTIYTLKNYGKVDINLKEILDSRKISRSKLSNMIALNYDLVNRYYNNKVSRVDLDVIARICYVLNCDVNDVLKFNMNK